MEIATKLNKHRKSHAPTELITIATKKKYRRQYDNLGNNVKPTFHLDYDEPCDEKFHFLYSKSIVEIQTANILVMTIFHCLHRKIVAFI